MPTAAGILDILCCLLSLLLLFLFVMGGMIMFVYYPLLIALSIITGFLAFLGGINTLNIKSWWKAVGGSLAAMLIFLPLMFTQNRDDNYFFLILFLICGFLGLISLGFVLSSRKCFKGEA
jgi:ABC-type Na+ efflux pump permease subunit